MNVSVIGRGNCISHLSSMPAAIDDA